MNSYIAISICASIFLYCMSESTKLEEVLTHIKRAIKDSFFPS